MKENISIGVFDSGFGGLEILREITKELPQYNYIYLGDTARVPYGNRFQEEVYNFTEQAVDFLFKRDCHLIIVACNTVSSEALRKIQQKYLPENYPEKRVLGVVIPVAEAAIETKNNRIGVIATQGTVNSSVFERELKKLNPKIKLFQRACPLLVAAIEDGKQDSKETRMLLENYLNPLLEKKVDVLILGCTHYGLLEKQIKEIVGDKVKIISEGKIVAEKLKDYLKRHPQIDNVLSKNSEIEFLTTDLTDKFKTLGTVFFGKPFDPKKIFL
ncbi:MAG: glutamate racemase [Patescibacteria group bacterium]|nr:glutamate racemase [Patescibacteria group bacterium]